MFRMILEGIHAAICWVAIIPFMMLGIIRETIAGAIRGIRYCTIDFWHDVIADIKWRNRRL